MPNSRISILDLNVPRGTIATTLTPGWLAGCYFVPRGTIMMKYVKIMKYTCIYSNDNINVVNYMKGF